MISFIIFWGIMNSIDWFMAHKQTLKISINKEIFPPMNRLSIVEKNKVLTFISID